MEKDKYEEVHLYTDGTNKGYQGEGSIGIVICNGHDIIHEYSECIGHCANNHAEYYALIEGLRQCVRFRPVTVRCYCDSEILVMQMNGLFQIRNVQLKVLIEEVINYARPFVRVTYQHRRRGNRHIDKAAYLLNEAYKRKHIVKRRLIPV
jgi:ribonuclease HI